MLTINSKIDNISNNKNYNALMRKSNCMLEIKRGNVGGNFP
jgi:hypothetical protein